jgi:hypothetical protein
MSRRTFVTGAGLSGLIAAASSHAMMQCPGNHEVEFGNGADGAKTSISISYYHAVGADKAATPKYDLFETVVLAKSHRDNA